MAFARKTREDFHRFLNACRLSHVFRARRKCRKI